jgi:hypothetical protein
MVLLKTETYAGGRLIKNKSEIEVHFVGFLTVNCEKCTVRLI